MIIKRKYVKFGKLFNDVETKKVLDEAWTVFDNIDEKSRWDFLYKEKIIDRDMGWAIPNPEKFFDTIEKGFELLDDTNPYDNGLNYSDVNKVEIVDNDENHIELFLINVFDGEENIVKVVDISN